MSVRVVAVVVSNDEPQYLQSALAALANQSFRVERTLVVDSSSNPEVDEVLNSFVSSSSHNAVLQIKESASFAELAATGIKQALQGYESIDDIAIWLLHDDSAPEVHALAELVRALELSPLVAIASPKQVSFENPKLIEQMGLTVTKSLKPFSLVTNELDQKQFDSMSDVLAVTSSAMLIRATSWADLGGYSLDAPELAADIDLGIRARHNGNRVIVVPTARVRHAQLTLSGKRKKKWLGGSVKYGIAKATNHLRLSHSPLLLAFLYWLALPAYSAIQVLWLLLVKRPDRILFTLKANLWAFFTIRARLRDRHGFQVKKFAQLFATREQVKAKARLAFEYAEQKLKLDSFGSSATPLRSNLGFAASGGLWWMFALIAISWQFLPLGESVNGGFALPLSDSWLQLFSNTGASFQSVGLGLAAPSDPFNWILLAIGSLTFWAPNLALSGLLLLAKALAFAGAWRLISLVTARGSLKSILALVYAFWPALTVSQNEGNFPAVIFSIALPWFIFSLARAARIGATTSVRSSEQAWSWIAVSGLLFAVVTLSAPSSLLALAVIGFVFAVIAYKRVGSLLFIALPTAALVLPYWLFQILGNDNWLGILADPTIAIPVEKKILLDQVIGGDHLLGWAALGFLGLAILSLLSKAKGILLAWFIAFVAFANLIFISGVSFTGGGVGSIFVDPTLTVQNSTAPALMLLVLAVLVAMALWLESLTRNGIRALVVGVAGLAVVGPLAVSSALSVSEVSFGQARNIPAIVTAEAAAGSPLKLLVITSDEDMHFRAEVIWPDGVRLDTISTAYRLSALNSGTLKDSPEQDLIADLVATLVSANGKNLTDSFKKSGIGYVVVPHRDGNGDLGVALNSVPQLEEVGVTEFGQLWRVREVSVQGKMELPLWSITKGVQLGVLVGFMLLALPTSRGRKKQTQLSPVESFNTEESE